MAGTDVEDFKVVRSSILGELFKEVATRLDDVEDNILFKVFANGHLLPTMVDKTLQDLGAPEGGTLLTVCTDLRAVQELEADVVASRSDRVRSLEDEAALEQSRRSGGPGVQLRPSRGEIQNWGFSRIEPLLIDPLTGGPYQQPTADEARKLLERLAYDRGIQAIMRKYSWRVGLLTELPPSLETGLVGISNQCLLGLNKNRGEEILLRLRTSDRVGFRHYHSIRETLVHELTHMVHSEHDASFWSLFNQLTRESRVMDWTQSQGHALAPEAHPPSSSQAAAAPSASRGYVLGGGRAVSSLVTGGVSHGGAAPGHNSLPETHAQSASAAGQGVTLKEAPSPQSAGSDAPRDQQPGSDSAEKPSDVSEVHGAGAPAGQGSGGAGEEPMAEDPMARTLEGAGALSLGGAGGTEAAGGAEAPRAGGTEVADGLAMLTSMGFEEGQARGALERFHGSLDRAADWLMRGGQEHGGGDHDMGVAAAEPDTAAAQGAASNEPPLDEEMTRVQASLQGAMQRLVGNLAPQWPEIRLALQTLQSLLANIKQFPNEERYRRIRVSNKAFQERVGRHPGGKEFLVAARFRYSPDGEFLECRSGDAAVVYLACEALSAALDALPAA